MIKDNYDNRKKPNKSAFAGSKAIAMVLAMIAIMLINNPQRSVADIVVTTSKSATAPTISTNDLAQTHYLSSSATGGNEVATQHGELFNGLIGNTDGGTTDPGEVLMSSANTFTVNFDISAAVNGYTITGIDSVFGWSPGANGRSNQGYEIILTFVDNSTATLAGPAHWEPNSPASFWTTVSFTNASGGALQSDTITTNGISSAGTGVTAVGVKAITFNITNDANAGGPVIGREVDIFGSRTFLGLSVGVPQFNAGNVLPSPIIAVSNDLFETSVLSVVGENASAKVRNGTTGTAKEGSTENPARQWGGSLGSTNNVTYTFDTSINKAGYDIEEIRVFSGWDAVLVDQIYTIYYSVVGSDDFVQLGDQVSFDKAEGSLMTRTFDDRGDLILTGVDQIRFGIVASWNGGTVFREFDVIGSATPLPPPKATIIMVQ